MTSTTESLPSPTPTPSDAGGVAARQGFDYQDHIAAQLVLAMLDDPGILRIECETADDIVVVRGPVGAERREYVQVKTTDDDTKWTRAEACARGSGLAANRPTSLIEKSFGCDTGGPGSSFRIVSRREVNKSLSGLRVPVGDDARDATAAEELGQKLLRQFPKTASPGGRDLAYWARNAFWQVAGSVEALTALNQQTLLRVAGQAGANPTHSHVVAIYEDLLGWVHRAASASRVTASAKKAIDHVSALSWWTAHLAATDAATRRTSKPYRAATDEFLAELHHVSEDEIRRALTGYDARYELSRWRSEQLAEYLADWLPEMTLKASELVEVQPLNLRHKMRAVMREIARHREIDTGRLLSEILLHAVLRHRLASEPIACKLFYRGAVGTKSFGNAHIVHADQKDELWLGRATLATAASYDAVLTAVVEELSHVLDPDFLKQEREVIVTLREPQHLLPTTLEAALARNAPIDDLLEALCIPVLIAYDSSILGTGFRTDYRERLVEEITERYVAIKPMLPSAVETIRVHVFLVPIECVETLSRQFSAKLVGA